MLAEPHLPECPLQALPDPVLIRERDQRLLGMRTLLDQMAHTFNNCLAPLAGYVTLLRDEIRQGTPGAQYLAKFDSSVVKAEAFLDSVLQAVHPERHFVPKPVNLALLVQHQLEEWRQALPSSPGITVRTDLAPCTLPLDERQWKKVLDELLRNARTALAKGGTLAITLRPHTFDSPAATDLGLKTSSVYELIIRDSGCGMAEDVLRRACDPLFSTWPLKPTAGLGLTSVLGIVHLHGGQLVLESVPQQGTTVRIWLPSAA